MTHEQQSHSSIASNAYSYGYIAMALRYLKHLEYDVEAFLEEIDLKDKYLNKQVLSMAEVVKCWSHAIKVTNNPAFPIKAGRKIRVSDYGDFGSLAMHCKDIGTLAEDLIYYHNLINNGEFTLSLEVHGDNHAYRLTPNHRYNDDFMAPIMEMAISIFTHTAFLLAAQYDIPDLGDSPELHFRHEPLASKEQYEKVFPIPVLFEQEHNQIVFAPQFREAKIYNANPKIYTIIKEKLDSEIALWLRDIAISKRVLAVLSSSPEPYKLTIAEVAKTLNTSVSSLQRKLAEDDVQFKVLKNDTVMERAKHMLASKNEPILNIALDLGFKEVNSFYRVFKRSANMTPTEFRSDLANRS